MLISSRTLRAYILKIALAAFVVSAFGDDRWPDVDFPEQSQVTIVADDMVFNGVAMKTWSFTSWQPPAKVLSFYRALWKDGQAGKPGYIEYEVGEWDVISHLQGDFQITVQLNKEENNTTMGLVGISRLLKLDRAPVLARSFPRIGNMQIINEIKAVDQEKKSRTIVAVTDASVASSLKYLRSEFRRKGWEEETAFAQYSGEPAFALMFRRRSAELNISLVRDADTTGIVAVFVNY